MSWLELVVKTGDDAGKRLELEQEIVIGRGTDTDLTLDDPEVSRRHAVVRVVGPGAEIEDLGSTNGTYVNGSQIDDPTTIGPGDEIGIGHTAIELEADVRNAETMTDEAGSTRAASTAPIRIDSGNVPRWQPETEEKHPRREPPAERSPTDEMSVGPHQSLLDRLPPLPWGLIVGGVIVLVVAIVLFKVLFGGSGTVSKKDFKVAANNVCHSTSLKAREFNPASAKTPKALNRAATRLAKIRTTGLHKIKNLDQPKKGKKLEAFYRSAAATTTSVRHLARATHAPKKRRAHAIAAARSSLHKTVGREARAARGYGLKKCGTTIGV